MTLRLQIAGGLAIYRLRNTNFKELLVPKAKTLLLTGDCLTISKSSKEISDKFMKYLVSNWNEVIYIPGRSELRAPGAAVSFDWLSKINFTYRTQYPLGSIYTIIGATYLNYGDTSWISKEETWVKDTVNSEIRKIILASYSPLPTGAIHKSVELIVHGTGTNQFNPTKPIVNSYCDYNGYLQSDYDPGFVVKI